MTILDKLIYLEDTKQAIRAAIQSKGVQISDTDTFRSYATFISQIESGSGVSPTAPLLRKVICGESLMPGDTVLIVRRKFPTTFSGPVLKTEPDLMTGVTCAGWNDGALSKDGNFLIVSNTSAPYFTSYKFDTGLGRFVRTASPDANARASNFSNIEVSSDGTYLLVSSWGTAPYMKTYKWSSANNRYEATADPDNVYSVNCASMTPDGQRLVIASSSAPYVIAYDWNATNNRYEKLADPNPTQTVRGYVKVSSDGQYVVSTATNVALTYVFCLKWSAQNSRYELVSTSGYSNWWCETASASGDGTVLISGGEAGIVPYTRTGDAFSSGYASHEGGFFPYITGNNRTTPFCTSDDGTLVALSYAGTVPTFILYSFDFATKKLTLVGAPNQADVTIRPSRILMSADNTRIVTLQNDTSTNKNISVFDNTSSMVMPEYYAIRSNTSIDPNYLYGVGFMTEEGSFGASRNVTCLWLKNDILKHQ